nr:unnamed protein product [Naegleria fowleri]
MKRTQPQPQINTMLPPPSKKAKHVSTPSSSSSSTKQSQTHPPPSPSNTPLKSHLQSMKRVFDQFITLMEKSTTHSSSTHLKIQECYSQMISQIIELKNQLSVQTHLLPLFVKSSTTTTTSSSQQHDDSTFSGWNGLEVLKTIFEFQNYIESFESNHQSKFIISPFFHQIIKLLVEITSNEEGSFVDENEYQNYMTFMDLLTQNEEFINILMDYIIKTLNQLIEALRHDDDNMEEEFINDCFSLIENIFEHDEEAITFISMKNIELLFKFIRNGIERSSGVHITTTNNNNTTNTINVNTTRANTTHANTTTTTISSTTNSVDTTHSLYSHYTQLYFYEILFLLVSSQTLFNYLHQEEHSSEMINLLLNVLNKFRINQNDVVEMDEMAENCFNTLASLFTMSDDFKKIFHEFEGIELMLKIIKDKKKYRLGAMRVLSYSMENLFELNIQQFVESGGLKTLFALFSRIGKKNQDDDQMETFIINILMNMLLKLVDEKKDQELKDRIISKFEELEKSKILSSLIYKYYKKVYLFDTLMEHNVEEFVVTFFGMDDEEFLTTRSPQEFFNSLSEQEISEKRLSMGGLYTLQRLCYVLAHVCASKKVLKFMSEELSREYKIQMETLQGILRDYFSIMMESGDESGDESSGGQEEGKSGDESGGGGGGQDKTSLSPYHSQLIQQLSLRDDDDEQQQAEP